VRSETLKFIYLLAVIVFWVSTSVLASSQDEINHLLRYVESTQCSYERNGSEYKGVDAVKHITKKYNYFKDKIKTTEDFIKLSATKSTMSGKFYSIHCNGKAPVKSQDWLLQELARYRAANK
jgi:hypothetical protein